MSFLLIGVGVVFCVGLAITGHLAGVIVGGILGSFFGVAGFGGAISGLIPGAVVGGILSIAIKRK